MPTSVSVRDLVEREELVTAGEEEGGEDDKEEETTGARGEVSHAESNSKDMNVIGRR